MRHGKTVGALVFLGLAALLCAAAPATVLAVSFSAPRVDSGNEAYPHAAAARDGMRLIMNGEPDRAIEIAQGIRREDADSPLGYLLEADALWWKIYLTTANLVDPDVFDVVYSKSSPYDVTFENLVETAIRRAEAQIRNGRDVPRNQLYEGIAYALRARWYGLRDSDLPTARASKKMRGLLMEAIQADPSLLDADAGIGLYNYFVDTLPTIIKMLKFLIGLPGGSRTEGLEQLRMCATKGDLVRGEAKFYLAKDFSRTSERQYENSLQLFQELIKEYPGNPLFKLVTASLEVRLGHNQEGEAFYRQALADSGKGNSDVQQALHREGEKALDRLHGGQKTAEGGQ